ncbi:MAG: ADP-ribosylation factor-like protein [Candidatus Hodarchaeales archaeon]
MKDIKVLLYGLENSGKSTLIESFRRERYYPGTPFTALNITEFSFEEDHTFTIIEVGGCIEVRNAVFEWLDHVQAIIFCIDGSDEDSYDEVVKEFNRIIEHPKSADKPLVILFNKKDIAKMPPSYVVGKLDILNRYDRPHNVFSVSAKEPDGFKDVLAWIYERLDEDRFPIEDQESRFITIFLLDMLEVSKTGLPLLAILGQLEIISRTGQISYDRDKILLKLRKLRSDGLIEYIESNSIWRITEKGLKKLQSSELIKGNKFERMKALLDSKEPVDTAKKKEILDEFDLDELAELYDRSGSKKH